uniref:Uncharacterized protein n=2 Tax=unclassified Caudoviricetes TaxID=2788787 RepID=A0AAU8HY64_9CAUD
MNIFDFDINVDEGKYTPVLKEISRPTKPSLKANHTPEDVIVYAEALKAYNLEKAEFETARDENRRISTTASNQFFIDSASIFGISEEKDARKFRNFVMLISESHEEIDGRVSFINDLYTVFGE